MTVGDERHATPSAHLPALASEKVPVPGRYRHERVGVRHDRALEASKESPLIGAPLRLILVVHPEVAEIGDPSRPHQCLEDESDHVREVRRTAGDHVVGPLPARHPGGSHGGAKDPEYVRLRIIALEKRSQAFEKREAPTLWQGCFRAVDGSIEVTQEGSSEPADADVLRRDLREEGAVVPLPARRQIPADDGHVVTMTGEVLDEAQSPPDSGPRHGREVEVHIKNPTAARSRHQDLARKTPMMYGENQGLAPSGSIAATRLRRPIELFLRASSSRERFSLPCQKPKWPPTCVTSMICASCMAARARRNDRLMHWIL